MSLQSKLQAELDSLTGAAQVLSVSEGEKRLRFDLSGSGKLACELDRLCAEADALQGASMDQLLDNSEQLSQRLTYLLEPLGPVEHDHQQCIVQMRSVPPEKNDAGTRYFELIVRKTGELVLCRYEKRVGAIRQRIPAHLTHEVLLRLADDIEAVLP